MVCERDPDSPYDPREGRINVVRRRRLGRRRGNDARCGQRHRRRGGDGGRRGRGRSRTGRSSCSSPCPRSRVSTGRRTSTRRSSPDDSYSIWTGRATRRITIGCAGSWHTFTRLRLDLEAVPADHAVREVVVSGARGGHSGGDIARGRVNAIKALGRALSAGFRVAPFRLALLEGGVSRNALPREARAVISLSRGEDVAFRGAVERELALGSRAVRRLRRCAVSCRDRFESSRRGRRIHDLPRARPAHDDSERGRRHEPESRRHGRDEHEPQRRRHRGRRAHARLDDAERQRARARGGGRRNRGRRATRRSRGRDSQVVPTVAARPRLRRCSSARERPSSACSA